ncbi:hypothetical protein WKT22_05128 [Candidatus Lokiarchaeum ossiferum]
MERIENLNKIGKERLLGKKKNKAIKLIFPTIYDVFYTPFN